MVRHYGVDGIVEHLHGLLPDPDAVQAVAVLRRDFCDHDAVRPRRVVEFLTGDPDEEIQADAAGFFRQLCRRLGA